MLRVYSALLLSLFLAACVSGPNEIGQILPADANLASSEQVMVITSRKPLADKSLLFGADRSDSLHFADITVSVPLSREPGSIKPPEGKPDLAKEFGVTAATLTDDEAIFAARLRTALAARPAGQRSIFIFTHGYNVSFAGGLFSAAQLHHDYKIPGVALNYS